MTNTIHSGDLWTFQDRTKSSFLMGPQSLPGWQGHSPSLLLHDAPGPPLAQDPRIHRGIATCCPGEVMAPLGPAHHLQTLIEQQVQGPAFPGGHQRGFCVRRKKRNSRKTFLSVCRATLLPVSGHVGGTDSVQNLEDLLCARYCACLGDAAIGARLIPTPGTPGRNQGRERHKS